MHCRAVPCIHRLNGKMICASEVVELEVREPPAARVMTRAACGGISICRLGARSQSKCGFTLYATDLRYPCDLDPHLGLSNSAPMYSRPRPRVSSFPAGRAPPTSSGCADRARPPQQDSKHSPRLTARFANRPHRRRPRAGHHFYSAPSPSLGRSSWAARGAKENDSVIAQGYMTEGRTRGGLPNNDPVLTSPRFRVGRIWWGGELTSTCFSQLTVRCLCRPRRTKITNGCIKRAVLRGSWRRWSARCRASSAAPPPTCPRPTPPTRKSHLPRASVPETAK